MRYIRTKNDVYELYYNSEFEHYEIIPKGLDRTRGQFFIGEDKIGNYETADTIEELCDEFVGVDKTCENGHQLLRAIPYKCANFWNGGVYGAIWTDKGLIYVAKLNDKGEFELI